MKNRVFLLFMLIAVSSFSQNLILNPGFEEGVKNWSNLWLREAGKGAAVLTDTVCHSGNHALHIEHWGAEDWSFSQNRRLDVVPGDYYQIGCWYQADALTGWAGISVITYKKDGSVDQWTYGGAACSENDEWVELQTAFEIPRNISQIQVRITGGGTGGLYFDDVCCQKLDYDSNPCHYDLENDVFRLNIETPSFVLRMKDQRINKTYTSKAIPGLIVENVTQTSGTLIFETRLLSVNRLVYMMFELTGTGFHCAIEADTAIVFTDPFLFPPAFQSNTSDFLMIPRASGMLWPVTKPYPFGDRFAMWDWKATMAFSGVTDLTAGYIIISENPWDTGIHFVKNDSTNCFDAQPANYPIKESWGENRFFNYVFTDAGGYVRLAKHYRAFTDSLGYARTFEEKIHDNANVDKLRGAVDFWMLSDLYSEEMMHSLPHYGVDRALISINGSWYDWLSNEQEMIESIHRQGYLAGRYDLFTDVWPSLYPDKPWYRSEGYPEDVIVRKDGSLQKGWLAYVDGVTPFQGYYTCSATHADYALKRIAEDLAENSYTARFIDVEQSSGLKECYSEDHPTTRHSDALHRTEAMRTVKEQFDLVTGSEEAREWAFPYTDYGEGTMTLQPAVNAGYSWANPVDDPGPAFIEYNMNPAVRIPLHGLVYHDVHVPTWYTGDGQSKVPAYWDDKDLFNLLYASMPLLMPPSKAGWNENREAYLNTINLVCGVTRECGFAQMTDHVFLTTDKRVQKTRFDNGWEVIANFSKSEYSFDGHQLPGKGFYASDGICEVFRKRVNGQTAAVVKLSDKLFVNPNGKQAELYGVRTTGSIVLIKKETCIELAFIGRQKEAAIHPRQIPWPVDDMRVIDALSGERLNTKIKSGGWIGFTKNQGSDFYRLQGEFNTAVRPAFLAKQCRLDANYPNPFNPFTVIPFYLPVKQSTRLTIYNCTGEVVITLTDRVLPAGHHTVIWTGKNEAGDQAANGLYLYSLETEDQIQNKRMLLLK